MSLCWDAALLSKVATILGMHHERHHQGSTELLGDGQEASDESDWELVLEGSVENDESEKCGVNRFVLQRRGLSATGVGDLGQRCLRYGGGPPLLPPLSSQPSLASAAVAPWRSKHRQVELLLEAVASAEARAGVCPARAATDRARRRL